MVQFYRKTEIVNDTGLFQVYPDLFSGQDTTIQIKGGTANRRGVFEYVLADQPTFGDAKLTAVRPNFYINSVDLNDSTELPRYKGYVYTKHLSDLASPEGGLSIRDETAVVINSVMSNDGAWLEEKFDGTPRQIGGDVPTLEVQNGTVVRSIDRAIKVDDLIAWLGASDVTGGDGEGFWSGLVDEAEYSDDFDEYLEKGELSLKSWLCTNYGMLAGNMQATTTREQGMFQQSMMGGILPASAGAVSGMIAGSVLSVPGAVAGGVAGAIVGTMQTSPDQYHFAGKTLNFATENYIIPLKHEKRRGRKDWYRPKKDNLGPSWWIHSKDIDRSGYLLKDLKIQRETESTVDVKTMVHPGNSVFDVVRRQKSYWIADPEDYNNEIEAAYTRSRFTSSGGLDGQAAQLETHWRHIDSAEVSDRAKMIGIALDGGQTIDTRQELLMSYGHIPRPSEKDVYHAGHLDVYPEGMAKAAGDFTGYENTASRNTLIYEKLLDSKVATKVSFTLNLQDLEYAWVEPEISSTASVSPATSLDGIITSRRGFFCTLSRNPVKQSKAGQRAQTFTDYLTDNITGVIDNNTLHTNMPGTFVLGFMNFPSDTTVSSTANAEDATGYIHKERQNKVSVVWSDYWDANYSATTDTKSIGWKVSNNANEDYQGHDGVASKGYYDIQWMGLTNAIEDQPTDDIVLLDADSWYTVDMYMHPDVPCVRVHITDGSGKRVDGNNILMFAGPNAATDTMEGIRTSATASAEGYNRNSRLGDESRWPAYCSFWLNNTHWRTTNDSASAKAGYDLVGTSGAADDTNQIDILTGAAAVDGTHASSTVLLDNFNIYNINTTKTFGTISNNCIRSAVSRLTTSSYSEIEGLYKPLNHYMDMGMVNGYSYIQDPDKDGSEFSSDGVSHIFVGDGGDGYTTAPTVSIAGDGSGASATAVLGTYPESPHATIPTDRVAAVTVDAAGTGYTYAPAVSVYGGGASDNAYVRASIGTSSPTREVVKNIPAPRYMSIGLDSKPSEMYVLYGNCAAASTVTKVVGGTDYSSTSMMSFGASGATRVDHVHKLDPVAKGAGMIPALSQTNPQTAEFSSTTDNELIGGKLKIHYSDMRVGDAGCQSAVRDIVRADNGTAAPFVEVWPPLPLEPDADDDWEIQTRSHILFNDLVTREVNNVSQMLPVPYDYSRSGYDASDATATLTPSRGVFNLGWGIAMGDVPDITTTPQITPRTISGNVENAGELAQAPHGTIEGGWYDISTTLQKIAKVITQVTPNKATSVLSCVKSYDNASDHRNPSGFRRKFTSPVDLTNCDIMVICRVPAKSVASTAIQIDAEADSSGNAHLQTLFGVGPTGGGGYSEQIARGPQFAATLRLGYKDIDASLEYLPNAVGAFCAHKNLFTLGDEASVYKRTGTTGDTLNAKTLANDRWVKLVFPTADYGLSADGNKNTTNATQQYMQAISELEFGLSFEKGGVSGNEEGIVYVSGVYAIPRNAGDVMMGFSNSTNGIGEISKETFLPIAHALPPSALDGTNSVEAGLTTGSTGGKKIVGLTMGGKEKLLAGYRVNEADFGASETTITIDAMTVGTEVHIHLDDRIMLGNSSEIMRVSAINAAKTELTVERGVDGTTAATTTANNSNIYVLTPSDADVIIRDYDYDVEGFTQKGFMSLGFDENSGKTRFNEGVTWQKRENPLAATRVIEVVRHTQQGIQVKIDQPEIFQSENNTNTTWIMYRETTRGVIPDGSNNGASSTFTFNKKQLNGDVLTLPTSDFFKSLPDQTSTYAPKQNYWISPYKYWVWIRFLPKIKGNSGYQLTDLEQFESPDAINFPKRSYKSIVTTTNRHKGASSTLNIGASAATHYSLSKKDVGPTWKESQFYDGKYLNVWDMEYASLRPMFEQGKDYGFGVAATEKPEGGHAFEDNALTGWNEQILPSVVALNNLVPGSKFSMMIAPQDTSQKYSFIINAQENSSNTPYLMTTFFDGLPAISNFTMIPDETSPMFPQFNWQVGGSDLWYGFIKIGTDAIYNQYHNKELHIPMNESTTSALTINSSTSNVTSSNIAMTREGLAGYAVDFNGSNSYLQYGATPATSDATSNCTTYMSVIAHIVPDSATDTRYILTQNIFSGSSYSTEKFYLRLNASNQVEAKVSYASDAAVTLTSGAVVPTDGYTPSVIILTVDTTSREGNVRLYVNGKLEDQTGLVDATGTSDNWKTGTSIFTGNSNIRVGSHQLYDTASFDGRIEEIVIYKDLIYPVDLKKQKYTLTKPLKELNANGKRLSHNIVLFVKDYHNIRGEKPEDVARSDSLTFSKSTPSVTGA